MIAPLSLPGMIAATRVDQCKAAIVARLGELCLGVKVVAHPGKLDINDVLAKAVVTAPGIAVGLSRVRGRRDIGGTFSMPVDWSAYLVTEDYGDRSVQPPRSVAREIVAYGIANHLLRILADPDVASWGLGGIGEVWSEPAPELRPLVTMKTAEQGTAVFAVTWTQELVLEGRGFFDGPTPPMSLDDSEFDRAFEFGMDDGPEPTEVLALLPRNPPA